MNKPYDKNPAVTPAKKDDQTRPNKNSPPLGNDDREPDADDTAQQAARGNGRSQLPQDGA